MNRVIILYAPDIPELKLAADRIKRAFVAEDFQAEARASKNCAIQDLALCDIVIVGFKDAKKWVHPDFAEIERALRGINFAGKTAGLFAIDADGMMDRFAKSFGDSDIAIVETALVVGNKEGEVKHTNLWVKNIIAGFNEGRHARSV